MNGCLSTRNVEVLFEKETFYVQLLFYLTGTLSFKYRHLIVLNRFLAIVAFIILIFDLYLNTNQFSSVLIKISNTLIKCITLSYVIIFLAFITTKSVKLFAKNGDYSYGLYIWGWPVQQLLFLISDGMNTYVFFLLSFIFTLILSILSWHLIEKNALNLKKRLIINKSANN